MNAKDIRTSIINQLTDNISEVGDRVYSGRAVPTLLNNLPAIVVLVPSRSGRIAEHTSGGFLTTYQAEVNVIVAQTDDYADTCDDILDAVKELLFGLDASPTWWNTYMNVEGYDEQMTLYNEGEKPIAIGAIRFQIEELETYQ